MLETNVVGSDKDKTPSKKKESNKNLLVQTS